MMANFFGGFPYLVWDALAGDFIDSVGVGQHLTNRDRGWNVWPGHLPRLLLPLFSPFLHQPCDGVEVVVGRESIKGWDFFYQRVIDLDAVLVVEHAPGESHPDGEEDVPSVIKEAPEFVVQERLEAVDGGPVRRSPVHGEGEVRDYLHRRF